LEFLSEWIDYPFSDWDWDAIRFGIQETSQPEQRWHRYDLFGTPEVSLAFARSEEASRLTVTWETEPALSPHLEFLTGLFQSPLEECEAWERLVEHVFSSALYPGDDRLMAGSPSHVAGCMECQEAKATFCGRQWSELVRAGERPPYGYGDLGFLLPEARAYFLPAYLTAALQDKTTHWLEVIPNLSELTARLTGEQQKLVALIARTVARWQTVGEK